MPEKGLAMAEGVELESNILHLRIIYPTGRIVIETPRVQRRLQHMHDATDDAAIVRSLRPASIGRLRLDPLPLLIAQSKQNPAQVPIPDKRIRSIWNQDCLVSAAKLMSFDPSHLERKFVT
jgi:hypothetical protein